MLPVGLVSIAIQLQALQPPSVVRVYTPDYIIALCFTCAHTHTHTHTHTRAGERLSLPPPTPLKEQHGVGGGVFPSYTGTVALVFAVHSLLAFPGKLVSLSCSHAIDLQICTTPAPFAGTVYEPRLWKS